MGLPCAGGGRGVCGEAQCCDDISSGSPGYFGQLGLLLRHCRYPVRPWSLGNPAGWRQLSWDSRKEVNHV
jgi:hypothetical protein